jgi:uncharacterized protein GlcG (DUF336 family)
MRHLQATIRSDVNELSWASTERIIERALREASQMELAISIAVVDSGRELIGFARQDGAMLASIQFAIGKAYTACSMRRPTMALAERTWSGADLHGLEISHGPPLVPLGGGAPLLRGGEMHGAIGVSGGTIAQDHDLAMRIAQAFEDESDQGA